MNVSQKQGIMAGRRMRAARVCTQAVAPSCKYWFFIHYLLKPQSIVANKRATTAHLSQEDRLQRVEAVLLLSREPQSSRKVAQLAGLADATEARTLIRLLNQRYDQSSRAFRVEEVAGGFSLLTRPQFAPWLRRLPHISGETRLTPSAMETLAIVAYRQPVLRADIEAIRGVGCGEIVKQLMIKDLVRICGRSEDLGRPYLYGTTRRFLQIFGLRSADRLPRVDWVNGPLAISATLMPDTLHSIIGQDSGTSIDAKESTVKKSFSAAMLGEDPHDFLEESRLTAQSLRADIDEDDDDELFDDDEVDDEDDDDDDEFEDDDELEDDEVDDEEDLDEDEAEIEDEEDLDEDDDEWEEVDDDEDEDEWEDDEDDDWEDDEEEEAEDEDDEDWD